MGDKVILLTDIQSFYASVEKVRNNEYKDKPLVVAGDPERRSGIILAACPLAKKYGIKTAETLWEAQNKCPDLIVVKPHMQTYIDVSLAISKIMEQFTDLVEPFSIDEQFMDISGSLRLFGNEYRIAHQLQQKILLETGVYARIGIGKNKILAKMACDNFAKKNENGIFKLDETNMEQLWKLPIGKMFGVGQRMEKHLQGMGIFTIGQLAKFPVDLLKKRWGINGEVIWQTANGIDYSPVSVKTYHQQKSIGHHMTLPRDYSEPEEIKIVLLELCTEVARRCRNKGYMGTTVSCRVRGADFNFPTGFYRQITLPIPTNFDMDIFKASYGLFLKYWDGRPVRSLGVSLTNLQTSDCYQIDLFDNYLYREKLNSALDAIWDKYGRTAIYRASSLTKAGQASERARKIGGHYK
ncbi:DNA polymerase IV [Bacillus ginsengihumi]|uniref:DNA polymerase IV n=1 Tax=Heyndrickxia ginsengihumi TaxID=363870 RepID=A0A0A6XXB2_9BACI|nr:DNA polymerase IV [Heyndrickxia ginsengihumi]KHD84752.1 DNA polymerase IV [Heyndrickxia ginsengihumi]NEY21444.1 DNA polymerase IV [Heyndrickxia ginsengihumi]